MPSAIVDVRYPYTKDQEIAILERVHACIVEAFKVSPDNRNVVLNVHAPHRFLGKPNVSAPERVTNVTVFALPGRSAAAKGRLYELLVTHLEAFGIPRDGVLVRLVELPAENFGVRGGMPLSAVDLGYPVAV